METGIIYLIANKVNNKVYVGQTDKTLEIRWRGHCYDASTGDTRHFYKAIRKYSKEAFDLTILETLPVDQLDAAEIKWISYYESFTDKSKGYNGTAGGGGIRGYRHTDEAKAAMSESRKGENHPNWGKTFSEETCRKLSEAAKGKKQSPEHVAKRMAAQTGEKNHFFNKTHSEETREKIRKIRAGSTASLETRQKMSESHRGKKRGPMSEGLKAKISAAKMGSKQSPELVAKRVAAVAAGRARKKAERLAAKEANNLVNNLVTKQS